MPLIAPVITANLITTFASGLIIGISMPQLASATASAFVTYNTTSVIVNTIDAGATTGPGVGVGFGIILPSPILIGTFTSSFSGHGILGIFAPSMISALANTFSFAYSLAGIITNHPSVGSGSGIASLIANPGASVTTFISTFQAFGLNGPSSPQLASAIAIGLDQAIPFAKGLVTIAGGVVPSPTIGNGTGNLI
jgi:hypothetical protein